MNRLQGTLLVGALIAVMGIAGCARESTTVRTEHQAAAAYPVPTPDPTQPSTVVEQHTVTTKTVADADEPRGVLSRAVHFVGEVIALPFRLVGALIRAIF